MDRTVEHLFTRLFYTASITELELEQMWHQDKNKLIRILFYLRQHRSQNRSITSESSMPTIIPTLKQSLRKVTGRGNRKIFYQCLHWLSHHHLSELIKLIPYIPDHGYWKDLLMLLGTPAEEAVIQLFATQLIKDYHSYNQHTPGLISMAAKWTPNEGSSFDRVHNIYGKLTRKMQISRRMLRKKYLVPLRKYLAITEQLISQKRWGAINYENVPKQALKLYHNLFMEKDPVRYGNYINRSQSEYYSRYHLPLFLNTMANSEREWSRIGKKEDADFIYAIDVSGSMAGFPTMIGMGLYTESSTTQWLPFLFEGGEEEQIKTSSVINDYDNIRLGMNLETCIKLSRSLYKRHLIVVTNILLDVSEIPTLPSNYYLTYWSINLNPITIIELPNCTIIEGYDLNIYLELKDGIFLTSSMYQDLILATFEAETHLPRF